MSLTEYLQDGHATLIAFSENASFKILEKTSTPPGLEGGGAVEQTTMRNVRARTKLPKQLYDVSDMSITGNYAGGTYDDAKAMLQVNQEITVTFPNGFTLVFWGWLDTFVPSSHSEGEQPEADLTIIASNLNDSLAETLPVVAAGTTTAAP